MTKNALVISGGGSKGAFAVGAIEYMVKELNIDFDIVAGTSIGALITPLVITNDISELVTIFSSLETKELLRKRCLLLALLCYDSIYDVTPGWKIIKKVINEEKAQKILDSKKLMFLTTVNLQTGQVVYFQSGPLAKLDDRTRVIRIETRDQLLKAVLASANQPVLMSPVQVMPDSDPASQYVDGGVRELAPLRIAIDTGATNIYAIVLAPEQHEPENVWFKKIPKILLRTVSLFVQEVTLNDCEIAKLYNKGIHYHNTLKERIVERFNLNSEEAEELFSAVEPLNPFKDKRIVSLHIIRPEHELPSEDLDFEPQVLVDMLQLGKSRAAEILGGAVSTGEPT
ncbi:MAG: patatin-like phospholipase family protein [bacterium]